jgi:hypothetical protein
MPPLLGDKQTSRGEPISVAIDPGCVKSRVSQGNAELFLNCRLPTEVASAIGFRIDETETDILHAN